MWRSITYPSSLHTITQDTYQHLEQYLQYNEDSSFSMRLTIIAPDNVYEHEVDSSMEVQDIQALIEAEVSAFTHSPLSFLPRHLYQD
jgi:hypothetical protein